MLAVDKGNTLRRGKCFGHFILGDRRLSAVLQLTDGLLFADVTVLADGSVDDVGEKLRDAVDDREVRLLDRAVFELPGQTPVSFLTLGDEHDAGGVSVEAVEDPRPPIPAGEAPFLAVVDQAVDEVSGPSP